MLRMTNHREAILDAPPKGRLFLKRSPGQGTSHCWLFYLLEFQLDAGALGDVGHVADSRDLDLVVL